MAGAHGVGNAVSSLHVVSAAASSSDSSPAPMWVSSRGLHFCMNCYRVGPSTFKWSIHFAGSWTKVWAYILQDTHQRQARILMSFLKMLVGPHCWEISFGQMTIVLKLDFGQLERKFFPCHPKRSKTQYISRKFHSCFPVPCRCGSAKHFKLEKLVHILKCGWTRLILVRMHLASNRQ